MTNRRTFLTQAGAMGASLLIAPNLLAAKAKPIAGLQLYTLREQLPKDVKGVIAKVAEAGYQEVEVFGFSKEKGFWGLKPADFKALLDQYGLKAPSGHYGMDQLLGNGDMADLDQSIAAAKALGHQYVTLPYINEKFRQTSVDIKNLIMRINQAAEHIHKADLKMAYHNHAFEFTPIDGLPLYTTMLKETDPKLIDFEMDLYWVIRAGADPVELFESHAGRFSMVHVKDMDKVDNKLNTEVGSGTINFKRIFSKSYLAGIKHYIVEQENFKIDPYLSIKQSSNYLRNVLLV